jgi:hypothetical protein
MYLHVFSMAEKIKTLSNFAISICFPWKHIERCTFISGYQKIHSHEQSYTQGSQIVKSGQNYIYII